MPKRRKIPTPVWERDHGAISRPFAGRSPRFFGAVAVVLLIVAALGLIGFGFLSDYIQDRNRPGSAALQIDDSEYTVREFASRLKTFVQQSGGAGSQGAQPQVAIPSLVEQLIAETVLLRFASEKEQGATDQEVNEEIAKQLGVTADDPNFQTRVQEELVRNGLAEQQYRDKIKATVLFKKLSDKFTAELPAAAESVHYRQIQVATLVEADALLAQIEAGADFAELASQKSGDGATKDIGGDAGWVPRGFLDKATEDALFALDASHITTFPTETGAFVYQVLEKQADRPLDEDKKSVLSGKAMQEWLKEKRDGLTITNAMDTTSGDADKIKYVVKHAYTQ
ncbi:MAG: peptidylprolyl isomerase [Dehalococcoidia bacterium]|nr:peptidylprolyl isomerase [Dehalococcoidia bacterium]